MTAAPAVRADYRGAPDYAEARVREAAVAVDAAQCALDDARARRDATAAEIQRTIESIRGLERALADAQRQLEDVDRALAALERELPARQAARDDAERPARDAALIVQQIHDEAWAPFSQSPKFVEAERALAREQARVDASLEQVHARLAEDREYRRLEDDARAAEEYLEALRDDPRADPNERAAASQRWLDAKAAVQRYRDEAVETDPAVRDARAALEEATRRHREMLDAFAASLDADPRMRAAQDELRAAEWSFASADQALREVVNARDAAARDLQNLDAERAAREAQLAQAHARVDELGRAIEALEHDVRRFEHDLGAAVAALDHAVRERDAADYAHRDVVVQFPHDFDHRRRHHDRDRDRERERDEDRGKRYEPREPKRDPTPPPAEEPRDPRRPHLIGDAEREQTKREADQKHEDARRALRERREAEWQQRREENKRREEEVEESKHRQEQPSPPPRTVDKPQKPSPPPRKAVPAPSDPPKSGPHPLPKVGPAPPPPKVGPQPPPRREEKKGEPEAPKRETKREPKKEEPRKTERKDDSSKDRGDRYRKGK